MHAHKYLSQAKLATKKAAVKSKINVLMRQLE